MEDESLRKEIYKILGLEFGSLSSESGNDWQRAKDDALSELKKIEFEKIKDLNQIDYLNVDKEDEDFKTVMNSKSGFVQNNKIDIAKRKDLNNEEIKCLINDGNKDIMIMLTRHQNLSEEHINLVIPNSVYLAKKYLVEKQSLTNNHKQLLITQMTNSPSNYSELLNILNT